MATLKTRSDASKIARRLETASLRLPPETQTTARVLTRGAVLIYRGFAPAGRTKRLRRGIRMVSSGGAYAVRADATNPDTGYDYVGVTRKGHRVKIIKLRSDRASASVIATGSARGTGRKAALRIVIGGRVLYRRSVKGYKPRGDWAERASIPVRKLARSSLTKLAQNVERLLR